MTKTLCTVLGLWILATKAWSAEPIEVMVLGAYHFGNPGADLHNMKADDVLLPKRQKELERIAEALATFKPTRIMVEESSHGPLFESESYKQFKPADLGSKRDETVQIGFRLAHKLDHKIVHAIDEQPGKGEPDYFPYEKVEAYVQKHGLKEQLSADNKKVGTALKSFEDMQKTATIAELLMARNDPEALPNSQASYYTLLQYGDGEDQPGAYLNAAWYLRNAKIFSKLVNVAKPGDRILVIYGAGHGYWLRHFAQETPGFKSVDPRPFLQKAR